MNPLKGKCYPLSEIMYQVLGGKDAGWTPQVLHMSNGETHWYIRHKTGAICDPTEYQYTFINYLDGKGCGFLTKNLSKRARKMLDKVK